MKKIWKGIGAAVILLVVILCVSYGSFRYGVAHYHDDMYQNGTIQDVGRLLPTKVKRVVRGKEEQQIIQTVKEAKDKGLKVSVAGMRHSQGGHTYYKDSVVLDMTSYNKILNVDPIHKTVHVQSGATWNDIQKKIAPYGLAIKVMQSQNIFTVGGSMSVNVHGRDIRNNALPDTINWFRLLKPDGTVVKVDKKTEPDLFRHAIGGYGLFGVILDVELSVTDDAWYDMQVKPMTVEKYPAYVHRMRSDPRIKMAYARISVAPDALLDKMYVVEYHESEYNKPLAPLKEDSGSWLSYELLNVSRLTNWGKNMFWNVQSSYVSSLDGSHITRNNAMRSESDFLLYRNPQNTDVLQEYFIPIDEFPAYVADMKRYLQHHDINLLNFTLRYVSHDETAALPYATNDMIAFVGLFNHGKGEQEVKQATADMRGLIDITLQHKGTFYLPYYPYATKQQLVRSYPTYPSFVQEKKKVDSQELFTNTFYEMYKDAK